MLYVILKLSMENYFKLIKMIDIYFEYDILIFERKNYAFK